MVFCICSGAFIGTKLRERVEKTDKDKISKIQKKQMIFLPRKSI